jgi:hypothetical protein
MPSARSIRRRGSCQRHWIDGQSERCDRRAVASRVEGPDVEEEGPVQRVAPATNHPGYATAVGLKGNRQLSAFTVGWWRR